MDALSWTIAVVAGIGMVGTVVEMIAIVRRVGRGLGIAGLVVRGAGLAVLAAFILAARGGPDFVALGYSLLGLLGAAALWAAATVIDIVLVVRHRPWEPGQR